MHKTLNIKSFYRCAAVFFGLAAIAGPACAHVKWFTEFDIVQPPLPINEVITGTFVYFFFASVASVYLFFLGDRYAYKQGWFVAFDNRLRSLDSLSIYIMRACAGIFFVSVWAYAQFAGSSFFLTPELVTQSPYVRWFQLAIGLCVLSRRAVPLVGAGILVLYAAGVHAYGLYHMTDYLIFLGIAYFFLVTGINKGRWRTSGFIVMYALMALTLLWASIEKFGYPHWTYPLLSRDPSLLMGLDPYTYMVLAGFVEFGVIFLLLGAVSIVTRLVALGLEAVFILAIFKFGLLDAVGHLLIIAILFVMIVRGPTDARGIMALPGKSIWMEAYFMTGLYFLAFVMTFIAYYGFHYLYYGA